MFSATLNAQFAPKNHIIANRCTEFFVVVVNNNDNDNNNLKILDISDPSLG
jgi:hypothetical protein